MEWDCFEKATHEDLDEIMMLIQKRIDWMDDNNIHQWNTTNYFECYPSSYFENLAAKGQLYVVKEKNLNRVIGAVALLKQDKRWNDNVPSYYIHNLVSDAGFSGIGARIIECCEELALKDGKERLRLDCQSSNEKLQAYYNDLGFKCVGRVEEGNYRGIKMEKRNRGRMDSVLRLLL